MPRLIRLMLDNRRFLTERDKDIKPFMGAACSRRSARLELSEEIGQVTPALTR